MSLLPERLNFVEHCHCQMYASVVVFSQFCLFSLFKLQGQKGKILNNLFHYSHICEKNSKCLVIMFMKQSTKTTEMDGRWNRYSENKGTILAILAM